MKQLKLLLLLILTFSMLVSSLTSCEQIEKLGIKLPFGKDDTPEETPEENPPEEKPDPQNCGHFVTTTQGAVDPTCSTVGKTGDEVCYVCGTVVVPGTDIPTLPHTYEDGFCTVCGAEEVDPFIAAKAEWESKYDCITIAEALELCLQFESAPSTDRYYIIATVKSVDDTSYGKLTIEDETGEIMVYGTNSADGSLKYDKMGISLKEGDLVLLYGTLQNYKGNTKEVQNGWLIDYVEKEIVPPTFTPDSTITIAEALELAGFTGNTRFYIRATVATVTNAKYGAMIIKDETGEISVYNSANADGSVGYEQMEDKPYKGDEVLLYCTLNNFNGSKEVQSGYIIEFTHKDPPINADDYTLSTIADARLAAKGEIVKVQGVVAKITYANGYKPSGFYLIDNTSSIYVYDVDAVSRVAEGNTVTIIGTKDFWILETETNNAASFGYAGCNQITDAYMLANDGEVSEFDKSWITETTVKDIMDTPVTENITTLVYKVTALVKKAPGQGFTNYYIDDIDGVTGSYVYTQCNGGDFDWLDQFDGKFCTVYLSVINAKSTAAGCVWRFLPIAVVDEGYTFDTTKAAEYAVKYHGIPSFESSYMINAKVDLPVIVDSELLGFTGATLSYSVSDTAIASISEIDGVLSFVALAEGDVVITVKGSYNGAEYEETVTVSISAQATYDYISIPDAIAAEDGTTVTVKGIVGPSAVNQNGTFYLITAEGAIPVRGASTIMTGLSIGDEVIVRGTRTVTKDGGGQIVIDNAEILANYYGENSYSTDSFIKDKTIDDVKAVADSPEATTQVYVLKVLITKSVSPYSTNYYVDGFMLYSGSPAQYAWLEAFFAEGETSAEVTLELALCDWNARGLKGCVLAVYNEDGTKTYNTYNFD